LLAAPLARQRGAAGRVGGEPAIAHRVVEIPASTPNARITTVAPRRSASSDTHACTAVGRTSEFGTDCHVGATWRRHAVSSVRV